MKSAIATTHEIDDLHEAADELATGIRQALVLQKNSLGILYYDYEMDGGTLAQYLQDELNINIVGGSTIATIDGADGYHTMAASLTVLSADDCEFITGVTAALTYDNSKQELISLYASLKQQAVFEPRMVYLIAPCGNDLVFDKDFRELTAINDEVPVIGGVPSTSADALTSYTMVHKGETFSCNCVMIVMCGNIKPVFTLANVLSSVSDKKGLITKSNDNVIREVDHIPFTDYMVQAYGINMTDIAEDPMHTFFQKYPFLLENPSGKNNDSPFVRILNHIDLEQKAAASFSTIPENHIVSLAVLNHSDIIQSVKIGIQKLLEKMQQTADYEYSTILCITCCARHLAITPHHSDEIKQIQQLLPSGINFSGFYSFGEFCPISFENDAAQNQMHNASIVFCAI